MSELIKAYSKEKQRRLNGEEITVIDREEYSTNDQIYNQNEIQAEIPPLLQPEILTPLAKDTQVSGGDIPIQQDTDIDEFLEVIFNNQSLLDQGRMLGHTKMGQPKFADYQYVLPTEQELIPEY